MADTADKKATKGKSKEPKTCYFYARGKCKNGERCPFAHGPLPSTTTKSADGKDKDDAAQNKRIQELKNAGEAKFELADEEAECNICFTSPTTYGLLQNCDHVFCLDCLLAWRKTRGKDTQEVEHAQCCPACRVPSPIVIPSDDFLRSSPAKKEKLVKHKNKLRRKPCPALLKSPADDRWCPFGKDCWFSHKLPDGSYHEFKHTHLDSIAARERGLDRPIVPRTAPPAATATPRPATTAAPAAERANAPAAAGTAAQTAARIATSAPSSAGAAPLNTRTAATGNTTAQQPQTRTQGASATRAGPSTVDNYGLGYIASFIHESFHLTQQAMSTPVTSVNARPNQTTTRATGQPTGASATATSAPAATPVNPNTASTPAQKKSAPSSSAPTSDAKQDAPRAVPTGSGSTASTPASTAKPAPSSSAAPAASSSSVKPTASTPASAAKPPVASTSAAKSPVASTSTSTLQAQPSTSKAPASSKAAPSTAKPAAAAAPKKDSDASARETKAMSELMKTCAALGIDTGPVLAMIDSLYPPDSAGNPSSTSQGKGKGKGKGKAKDKTQAGSSSSSSKKATDPDLFNPSDLESEFFDVSGDWTGSPPYKSDRAHLRAKWIASALLVMIIMTPGTAESLHDMPGEDIIKMAAFVGAAMPIPMGSETVPYDRKHDHPLWPRKLWTEYTLGIPRDIALPPATTFDGMMNLRGRSATVVEWIDKHINAKQWEEHLDFITALPDYKLMLAGYEVPKVCHCAECQAAKCDCSDCEQERLEEAARARKEDPKGKGKGTTHSATSGSSSSAAMGKTASTASSTAASNTRSPFNLSGMFAKKSAPAAAAPAKTNATAAPKTAASGSSTQQAPSSTSRATGSHSANSTFSASQPFPGIHTFSFSFPAPAPFPNATRPPAAPAPASGSASASASSSTQAASASKTPSSSSTAKSANKKKK